VNLEQWGALAAIFTFSGATVAASYHVIQQCSRRKRVEKYLSEAVETYNASRHLNSPHIVPHRFLNQIAADLRMTSAQAYEAAVGNKNIECGQTGGADGKFWFKFNTSKK